MAKVKDSLLKQVCSVSYVSCKRGTARICCCGACRAAVGQYLPPARLTAANPLHAAAAGEWDSRYRPCSAYCTANANKAIVNIRLHQLGESWKAAVKMLCMV